MTGNDIVKALTESGLLDKEIDSIEFESGEWEACFTYESSHEYIGEDEVMYHDVDLLISEGGQWKLHDVTWVG